MKQLFFSLAAMVLLFSCNDTRVAGSGHGGDHAALADRHAEATKKVFHAIETGDTKGLDTLFTEDMVDHDAGPEGQDIKGRDSVIAMIGQIHTYFDGLRLEIQQHATSNDGQYHYATVRMTGKAKENPWGMPPGTDVDDTSVDVVRIKDGKAAEHWGFMSMKDFNEIMAMMKGGGAPPPTSKPATADTSKKR